jgi:uncharacterized protein YndB with AHSA1/START domain
MDDYGVTGARIDVEVLVELPVAEVWQLITAVDRYGEWSPECVYGRWLDVPIEAGARFLAGNRFPNGLETHVECVVTVAEEPTRFGWDVYAEEAVPFAHWEYELRPQGDRTLVRQWFVHGPGDSGMRAGVAAAAPEGADEAREQRLKQLGRNMETTIAAMVTRGRTP